VKLTVLMPACDWPRGSGMLNPNTPNAVRSVLESGVDDLLLYVATDGEQPAIAHYLASLDDPRIHVWPTVKSKNSGNAQRHFLMKKLVERHKSGLFCFHDDDDAYLPGALKAMVDLSIEHDSVPVLARHVRPLLSHITTPEAIDHVSGLTWAFKMPISFAASVFPVMEGMPLWPSGGGYYDDLPYAQELVQWFEDHGKKVMLFDRTVTRIRPQDGLGSLVQEFH
jgi:hypothetical protein